MRHIGLDFDEVPVSLYSESMIDQLNPYFSNNKVPVLLHNGLEIWDSLAILEYLSGLSSDQGLPVDSRARAAARALCAEMHSSFSTLRNELPMNCRRQPSPLLLSDACTADIDRIQALWQHANGFSDGMEHWLFGSFSIVDAMFAPVAIRFHGYCVPLEDSAAAYVGRLLQHPAIIEWIDAGSAESMIIEQEER